MLNNLKTGKALHKTHPNLEFVMMLPKDKNELKVGLNETNFYFSVYRFQKFPILIFYNSYRYTDLHIVEIPDDARIMNEYYDWHGDKPFRVDKIILTEKFYDFSGFQNVSIFRHLSLKGLTFDEVVDKYHNSIGFVNCLKTDDINIWRDKIKLILGTGRWCSCTPSKINYMNSLMILYYKGISKNGTPDNFKKDVYYKNVKLAYAYDFNKHRDITRIPKLFRTRNMVKK